MKKIIIGILVVTVFVTGLIVANNLGWEQKDCNDIPESERGYYQGRCVDGGGKSFSQFAGNFIVVEIILGMVALFIYLGSQEFAIWLKKKFSRSNRVFHQSQQKIQS